MEKLGVEVDTEKVKEAEQKKPAKPGEKLPETNVPWDPEKGTEPFEKRPEKKD